MKISSLFFLVLLGLGFAGCQSGGGVTSGTLISGQLDGAANIPANLDRISLTARNNTTPLVQTPVDANGKFAFGFENGLEPGLYQLRIGAQKAALYLEAGDTDVQITGKVSDLQNYGFTVAGSESSLELVSAMRGLSSNSRGLKVEDVEQAVQSVDNDEAAAFIAFTTLARAGQAGLPLLKEVNDRLAATSPLKRDFGSMVSSIETQVLQQQAAEVIRVGMPAPDITAKSPDGKTYSLSDLKGQVVLLDFWASWCGPCRRENPNVVKVYDKYKDDGFTIYSVSLDGLDPRRTAGYTPDQIAQGNKAQIKRWTDAIAKDKLSWPYHVSELKKWGSEAGARYGVRGIPKTFLIDREGKIAAVGLRGARSIEQALQKVI